jgi:hypothetical protein
MRTCHLTKAPLDFSEQIVACPYGRLYSKEAAVEALLRRKHHDSTKGDELGSHVRGLKDLHSARFRVQEKNIPVCPVTGVELNGTHAALLIPKKGNECNVLSERALKEMGIQALQADYGPFEKDDLIRLAPPDSAMEEIQANVAKKQELEKATKKSKKDGKKRKKHHDEDKASPKKKAPRTTVAGAARERVASAVASNEVLSSLFTTSGKGAASEKERNDRLFTVGTS